MEAGGVRYDAVQVKKNSVVLVAVNQVVLSGLRMRCTPHTRALLPWGAAHVSKRPRGKPQ